MHPRIRLTALTAARWHDQSGRCFYCLRLTWLGGVDEPGDPNLQATGEHLHRRSDGGSNHWRNIVMACWQCNNDRELGVAGRDVLAHVRFCMIKHQAWDRAPSQLAIELRAGSPAQMQRSTFRTRRRTQREIDECGQGLR